MTTPSRAALDALPDDALLPAVWVRALVEELHVEPEPVTDPELAEQTWRERLWTVPADTRLGVVEVAEALGRPKSYVYARTGESAEDPLPCRKLDGTLVFLAGELREWIQEREEVVHRGRPAHGLRVS